MTDGERETMSEIRNDAAADWTAWTVECQICGLRILGDYGDLDGHLAQCDGDWEIEDLITGEGRAA